MFVHNFSVNFPLPALRSFHNHFCVNCKQAQMNAKRSFEWSLTAARHAVVHTAVKDPSHLQIDRYAVNLLHLHRIDA